LIAQLSDGGVRDALSILEQVIAYSEDHLTAQHVNDIYGIATTQDKLLLLSAIQNQDVNRLMAEIEEITQKNIDIRRLTNDLMELLKESVIYAYTTDGGLLQKLSVEEAKALNAIPSPVALKMIDDLMETAEKYRSASDVLSYFEIGLLKLIGRLAPATPVVPTRSTTEPPVVTPPVVQEQAEKHESRIEEPQPPHFSEEPEPSDEKPRREEQPVEPVIVVEGNQAALNLGEPEAVDRSGLESQELAQTFVLQLLVNAEKQLRMTDAELWKNTASLALESAFMKSLTLIAESTIQASGAQFVLLSFDNPLRVHAINDPKNIADFAKLTERLLNRKARLFALSTTDFDRIKTEFLNQLKSGNLPNRTELDLFPHKKTRKKQEDPLVKSASDFFEQDAIVIVGGDES
jgi:DNA polymerase III subunit gamma/tau